MKPPLQPHERFSGGRVHERDQRKVYKREREQIKDEMVISLLPRAFPQSKRLYVLIDTATGLVYSDTSSSKNAEEALSLIRDVLGSFPVRPIRAKLNPGQVMTEWAKEQTAPEKFSLHDNWSLSDQSQDGAAIKGKNQDLGDESVQSLIASGKQVIEIRLGYDDHLAFTLDTQLALKSIRYEDVFADAVSEQSGEDSEAVFDSQLAVMGLTLRAMVPALLENLGGEDVPEGI